MKRMLAAILMSLAVMGGLAQAGGSVGGGGVGALVLELETAALTRDQFSALVLAGSEDRGVELNSYKARVLTVNFQSKTVELEIPEIDEIVVLEASDK